MADESGEEFSNIENIIVGLYNILYEDSMTTSDIEFYELEDEEYEGEIYLPYIGLNVELWREWETEKQVEVLIHEFAHTENYDDDHHPDFWDRVVELTEIASSHEPKIETLFDDSFSPKELKETVVDSIHEYVIDTEVDTVGARKKEVRAALGISADRASTD